MIRVGMLARADDAGLGSQTWEFHRHMRPDAVVVMDLGEYGCGQVHLDRYSDAPELRVNHGRLLSDESAAWLFQRCDVIYTAETTYRNGEDLYATARAAKVATVLHANPELYRTTSSWRPDVIANPTTYEHHRLPSDAVVMPMPVARDRLPFRPRDSVWSFLHVTGSAMADRNGTNIVMGALHFVRTPMRLVVAGADPRASHCGVVEITHAPHVENYWELYDLADAYVDVRRYAGLNLPLQEAMSAGMPVVTSAMPHVRGVVHDDCLVPLEGYSEVRMRGGMFPVYRCDPRALAAVMDRLATDAAFAAQCSRRSDETAATLSWEAQAPRVREVLDRAAALVLER